MPARPAYMRDAPLVIVDEKGNEMHVSLAKYVLDAVHRKTGTMAQRIDSTLHDAADEELDEEQFIVDNAREKINDQVMRIHAPAHAKVGRADRVLHDKHHDQPRGRLGGGDRKRVAPPANISERSTSVTNLGRVITHPAAYGRTPLSATRSANAPGKELRRSMSAALTRSTISPVPDHVRAKLIRSLSRDQPRPDAFSTFARSLSARRAVRDTSVSPHDSPVATAAASISPQRTTSINRERLPRSGGLLARHLSRRASRREESSPSPDGATTAAAATAAISPDFGAQLKRESSRRTTKKEQVNTPSKLSFLTIEVRCTKILDTGLTTLRIPQISLSAYGGTRSTWAFDAFSLPHNAVRRDCVDVYDVLRALASLREVTTDDICDMRELWSATHSLLHLYFDIERKILFPFVDAATMGTDARNALENMRAMKDTLKSALTQVQSALQDPSEAPESTFTGVYNAVDAFFPRLLTYFADQELLLPSVLRQHYSFDQKAKVDRQLVLEFLGHATKDDPHHNIVLLVNGIENVKLQRAWIAKNLAASDRAALPKWTTQFEYEHLRIVRSLRNRTK